MRADRAVEPTKSEKSPRLGDARPCRAEQPARPLQRLAGLCHALFRARFFAPVRLGMVLAKRFPGFDLAASPLYLAWASGSCRPGCAPLTFFSLGSLASSVEPSSSPSN
jgi:hypothetical protein